MTRTLFYLLIFVFVLALVDRRVAETIARWIDDPAQTVLGWIGR